MSLRQVRELFQQFRQTYRKLEKRVQDSGATQKLLESGTEVKAFTKEASKGIAEDKKVGETEETAAGFGLGRAPNASKPRQPVDVLGKSMKAKEEPEEQEVREEERDVEDMPGTQIQMRKEKKVEVLDRQTAFIEYKKGEGKPTEEAILSNRSDFKEKTLRVKQLEREIDVQKAEIDKLTEQLDKKRESSKREIESMGDVIDEEEFAIIKKIKDHKKIHKQSYDERKGVKSDLIIIKRNIDQLKQQLIISFDEWYDKTYGPYLNSPGKASMMESIKIEGEQGEYEQKLEEEIDPDALAYARAKKKVETIQKAKKIERMKLTLK